ncbi:MAG: glycine--tRNA ligase subunit beta [Acidobacteria bacterium]|nr:glycine--tRNA ligase subunit beta [Acidobacteriota bacterium]
MADLLLEIGTEEIPARMIDAAAAEVEQRVLAVLRGERLINAPQSERLSTPRRIAVLARGVFESQADVTEQVTGPPVKAAFKDGAPTPAAHAFARKSGVEVGQLQRITTPKGEYLAATVTQRGRSASEVLRDALPPEIAALSWPKNMYWRPGKPELFVRPVRWLVALLGGEVIPLEFAGIRAGRQSYGHRILAGSQPVEVARPATYAPALEKNSVLVDPAVRRALIISGLQAALAGGGLRYRADEPLLGTAVNLTEFPSVILGSFDRQFLTLPEEVLVTVMRDHQKYFAVDDAEGRLAPHFLAVLNTPGDAAGLIRHGNERVLRARFNDARFFWETDQKIPLRNRVELLKHVTFQKDLGSYHEKTLRVQRFASAVCEALRSAGVSVRAGIVHKAALLAKADLTTELVKEFTELQGVVGGLYARVQQLSRDSEPRLPEEARNAVASAIYDHYKPESMDDAVPRTLEGGVLSLCDKADSILGMFALGLIPSGSKDPFALRRQGNAIIRILAEYRMPLRLSEIFVSAYGSYTGSDAEKRFVSPDRLAQRASHERRFERASRFIAGEHAPAAACVTAVLEFMAERLEFYLRDALGIPYDVVNAVLASGFDGVSDAFARARAVSEVRGTPDFTAISAAFKRMKNILRQAQEKGIAIPATNTTSPPAGKDAEQALAEALARVQPHFRSSRAAGEYAAALGEMARMRRPVDEFFDGIMVMVDDHEVRARRLSLLNAIVEEFSGIADFSEIATEA